MKRFYKDVRSRRREGGFRRAAGWQAGQDAGAQYPGAADRALAAAIAAEWRGQGEEIIATSMPLLRLANTVIDGVAANREEVIAAILRFGENDLLCYRAHQPPDLVARQSAGWDPLLDWARRRHGANMTRGRGLQPCRPDAGCAGWPCARRWKGLILSPWAALHVIASITGSLVLALAVADGATTGAQVFELSRIDETYQAEKWGEDAEAAKRATRLAHELDKAVELMAASRHPA